MHVLDIHTFQDGVTTTGNGNVYTVKGKGTVMTFQITGTSTSRTLVFEASVDGTNFVAVKCANLSILSLETQTTGSDEIWQYDLSGIHSFRVRIGAVAGGNITVIGRAVA
jgi:hypothetical protein